MDSETQNPWLSDDEIARSQADFVQSVPLPVFQFAEDGRLISVNDSAMALCESLSKEDPSRLLPPDVATVVTRVASTRDEETIETLLGTRAFRWTFFPSAAGGSVHCYVLEVTDRMNLESQLRHSQKLGAVGRLAAGVAHDFNNMLTVIRGHTGLLRAGANLSGEMRESVQQVSRAAERASKLTGQLLAFLRKSVMQPKEIELNDVLASISTMLYRTLGEDLAFQFSYAPDLPTVFADAGMLEQVIMNLAVNARDAMPDGGQLIISTKLVEVDEAHAREVADARAGRFVRLSLSDTGCGMDQDTLGRLFEPFYTTKDSGKGTGLGLATVYGIVKQHGGWIEVRSQLGQGTTFNVFLPPSAEGAAVELERPADETVAPGTETVLLVEDEAPVRMTARNILERYGYRVIEASNGMEALALWHRHHQDISLLLTDLVMPVGLNGQELAAKFGFTKPDLKVVYISGYSRDVAGRDLDSQDGHFLEKPFDARTLAQTVRECLDR